MIFGNMEKRICGSGLVFPTRKICYSTGGNREVFGIANGNFGVNVLAEGRLVRRPGAVFMRVGGIESAENGYLCSLLRQILLRKGFPRNNALAIRIT